MKQFHPKCWYITTKLHDVTTQNKTIIIAVSTSCCTLLSLLGLLRSSETSVKIYQTIRHQIPDAGTLQSHRYKSLKCKSLLSVSNIPRYIVKCSEMIYEILTYCYIVNLCLILCLVLVPSFIYICFYTRSIYPLELPSITHSYRAVQLSSSRCQHLLHFISLLFYNRQASWQCALAELVKMF
jgi:hypothetical protein